MLIAKKFTVLSQNGSNAAWWSPRVGEKVIEHPICLLTCQKLMNTNVAGNEYVRGLVESQPVPPFDEVYATNARDETTKRAGRMRGVISGLRICGRDIYKPPETVFV